MLCSIKTFHYGIQLAFVCQSLGLNSFAFLDPNSSLLSETMRAKGSHIPSILDSHRTEPITNIFTSTSPCPFSMSKIFTSWSSSPCPARSSLTRAHEENLWHNLVESCSKATSTLTFCLKSQILSGCDVSEGGGMWLQMSLHCFHCLGKQRVWMIILNIAPIDILGSWPFECMKQLKLANSNCG